MIESKIENLQCILHSCVSIICIEKHWVFRKVLASKILSMDIWRASNCTSDACNGLWEHHSFSKYSFKSVTQFRPALLKLTFVDPFVKFCLKIAAIVNMLVCKTKWEYAISFFFYHSIVSEECNFRPTQPKRWSGYRVAK